MKIVTVIGTRPQFIKAALISEAIVKTKHLKPKIEEVLVNTGQHYDYNMSKKFFEEFNIPTPDYNLNIGSMPHVKQITKMMQRLEVIFKKEKPDMLLVYGDTNSTLAGALTAAKVRITICHIEAGLRSFDKSMPEEINRVVTDHVSSILFCPTEEALNNLQKENITKDIYLVGDIMYELAIKTTEPSLTKSKILDSLGLKPKKYILVTVHREFNTDFRSNLQPIVHALCRIKTTVVFPMHPRTKKMLKRFGFLKKLAKNVKVIEPVGYIDMICLEKNADKIITDSGGVQKEAYFFKVPCLTLREKTEWVETLNNGWNVLVGTDPKKIVVQAHSNITPARYIYYYGDGHTSTKILEVLKKISLSR